MLRNRIKNYIVTNLIVTEKVLEDDESLFASGLLDSLGHVNLISFLEDEFNISVHMDELNPNNFDTISNIESFVLKKLREDKE